MSLHLALWVVLVAADLGPPAPPQAVTVTAAVAEAQQSGPAGRRAKLVFDQAVAAVRRTRPVLRPDLAVVGAAGARTPQVRDAAVPHAIVERDADARLAVTARQTVWRSGSDHLERRAAAGLAAAAADYQAALARIAYDTAAAWYDLLTAKAGYAVADDGVKAAESQLDRVRDLVKLEKVAEVDVLTAEAGVLEARGARLEAANGVDLAAASLNRQLGHRDLEQAISPAGSEALPAPLPPLPAAVSWAQEHRPEVVALLARIAEARAGAAFARSDKRPSLDVVGNVTAQTPSAFRPSTEAGLGVEVHWPLSRMDDAPGRQAGEAGDAAQLAQLGLDELRSGIALEVRKAHRDEQTARQRLELATARAATAAEAHRIRLLQYERGRATLLEVQQALLERRRAELDRIRARYEIYRAVAAFELATGRPNLTLGPS